MTINIAETIDHMFDKNDNIAYKALKVLQKESEENDNIFLYRWICEWDLH